MGSNEEINKEEKIMSEEKSVRELEKELKAARNKERNAREITVNKRLDYIEHDPTTTKKKDIPDSTDIPDYVGLPKIQNRPENKW